MNITFDNKHHKYTKGDKVYTSVSKTIERFKNPFDKEHWSTYKAIEALYLIDNTAEKWRTLKKGWDISDPSFITHATQFIDHDKLQNSTQGIVKEWSDKNKKSIVRGNTYHDSREKESYKKGFELNPISGEQVKVPQIVYDKQEKVKASGEYQNTSLIDNLYDLEDGYYPELLLWNEEYMIAGQADKVFISTVDGVRYIEVGDFKTNNKIRKKSYYNRAQRSNTMMKHPINHLMDCNLIHYNLQISMYCWMLEQFGYTVKNLSFHHFNEMYKLEYLKKEVEDMLNHSSPGDIPKTI